MRTMGFWWIASVLMIVWGLALQLLLDSPEQGAAWLVGGIVLMAVAENRA